MKQYRLNNCLLMHCHKSITDTLDAVIIAKRFASVNEQLKGILENLSRGMRMAGWKMLLPAPLSFKTLRCLCKPPPPPVRYGYQPDTCSRLKKQMNRSNKKKARFSFFFSYSTYFHIRFNILANPTSVIS